MAGHSHWARIKRAKAVTDARRGKLWGKLSRAIIVAARQGGGDPATNLQLRYAIDAARDANMPKDTIERAIKRGTGELGGEEYVEMVFEGYGPGGAAVLATALTDNRNRTAPEIKKAFERRGGKLGATGSVAWMFSKRGVVVVRKDRADEERLTEIALEVGADDVRDDEDAWEIQCEPEVFERLRQALREAQIEAESASISMVPTTTVTLHGQDAERMVRLIEDLEEHDDIQQVYSNYEIAEEEMARLMQ